MTTDDNSFIVTKEKKHLIKLALFTRANRVINLIRIVLFTTQGCWEVFRDFPICVLLITNHTNSTTLCAIIVTILSVIYNR